MAEDIKKTEVEKSDSEQYSLNDDRRVKVLSPGALVAKRFFRNKIAMVGLVVLIAMFLFSFVGGLVSPYDEDQFFYRDDIMMKDYATAVENDALRFSQADGQSFDGVMQAQAVLAINTKAGSFDYKDVTYTVKGADDNLYSVYNGDTLVGIASKNVISPSKSDASFDFTFKFASLTAYAEGKSEFEADGITYAIDDSGLIVSGEEEIGYISRFVVQAAMSDQFLTRDFKEQLLSVLDDNRELLRDPEERVEFKFTGEDGEELEYEISYDAARTAFKVKEEKTTHVYDKYSFPSKAHWLGTDKNGMDMLTRLMYGGRVSLVIGFIVEIISTFIGVILGGISGYFGGWVDNLIMRIVDIFYCIPSMPIIIIIGAAMDAMNLDPKIRMIYLMLILGILGWPGVARMIRGLILSLREQEFMTATEACGVRVSRRIFRHLIPNVIPQLIVSCTMGLGGTIITEATLSFLGLGVRFPFASWGNIINDVKDTFVLTNYWFIWIPAGVLLLLTVLAFNIVGDGLRDAFDPKMKR